MKNELAFIQNKIYVLRNQRVMLDFDLASMYGVQTKVLNQAVKRNIERFPEEFCFQLSELEYNSLKSQTATLKNSGRGKHRKYLPYVFTEHGITMIAGLLNSDIAVNVSIKIVNSFIEMRKFLASNGQIFQRLTNVEYKLLEHDKKFDQIFDNLQKEENISLWCFNKRCR